MPFTVSVSAFALSLFGASHCRPYHSRIRSRACDSEIFSGSNDSGRNGSLTSSYGTSAVDPQKSQRRPTTSASNTEIAWQLWQRTEVFGACQPRDESGMARSAAARSCSTISVSAPRVVSVAGDSVPQNGQMSACLAGFQFASAPQAGQWNFWRADAIGSVDPSASEFVTMTGLWSRRGYFRNSASALFVMRHWAPMRLPLRSPASRLAITSASDTPSAFAASAGPTVSGMPEAAAAAGVVWRHDTARLVEHLLGHGHPHGDLRANAGDAGAAFLHALGHLILDVVVQVADRGHARALVDRLLDFRRYRYVLDHERRHRNPVLLAERRIDERQERISELAVTRRDVEHRYSLVARASLKTLTIRDRMTSANSSSRK